MIRTFTIQREKVDETLSWLREYVSEENVRWWIVNELNPIWDGATGHRTYDLRISIDVPQEEESYLTQFILRWC